MNMPGSYQTDNLIVYDLEVFPCWFLAGFQLPNGAIYQYEIDGADTYRHLEQLKHFLQWYRGAGFELAGFNSLGYDDPVLCAFLAAGGSPRKAYQTSVDIIVNDAPPWSYDNHINSIDLMQILPGRIGLKKIGVCLGHRRLQELPIPYDKTPTHEDRQVLRSYNINDLDITRKLLIEIQPELDLRATMSIRYGVDLRSKGEATLAEIAILEEYKRIEKAAGRNALTKKELNRNATEIVKKTGHVQVAPPSWWHVMEQSPNLAVSKVVGLANEIFERKIPLDVNGRLQRGVLDRQLYLGDRYYKLGVGGLHSVDGPGCWVPEADEFLVSVDVASYYPNIVLTQNLAPRQWGESFLPIYRDIVERRLKAKREGDKVTASILKISANGTYGKSSDIFSSLYDPQLTANVTVLGQITLLILIAALDGTATTVSANTDGILVLGKKGNYEDVKKIISQWEAITGFVMEYDEVAGYYQKDVNNFIQVNESGKLKTKGIFKDDWPNLRGMPAYNIVATALRNRIKDGTEFTRTLYGCTDINQFILTQAVTGGYTTSWCDQPLGKVLRFYKSNSPHAAPIIRTPGPTDKGNQGNVPNSEGCIPLEDLPEEFPDDVNYAWYLQEAEKLWALISRPKKLGLNRWAEYLSSLGLRPCYVDTETKTLSRARVVYGETDFCSQPEGMQMGTGTGEGLLARLRDTHTQLFRVKGEYPTQTRAKVRKDHGFKQLYGARVPLSGYYEVVEEPDEIELSEHYTPAELRKVDDGI